MGSEVLCFRVIHPSVHVCSGRGTLRWLIAVDFGSFYKCQNICNHRHWLFFFLPRTNDELPIPFCSLPPLVSPPISLEVGPYIQLGGLRDRCKLPNGVWGKAPADKRFVCILGLKSAALVTAVFIDFPKNKCNFLHRNKLDIVRQVQFLTGWCPVFFTWGSCHHYPVEVGACVSKDCSTVAFLVDSNVTFSDELCNTASWPTCCTQMWVFGVMNLLWLALVGNTCSSQCIVEKT